jgi:hypothetical protein
MLQQFVVPQVEDLQPTVIFQQDGAPPHWGRIVRDCLGATFPNLWLGRDGQLAWPPRSPDITPLDFVLWGYGKDKVYATKVTGDEDLNTLIMDVITTINIGMLARIWKELEFRLDVLRATQGAHIEVRWVHEKKTLCIYPSNKISFTFFLAIYIFYLSCKIGQRRLAHSV